MGDGEDYEPLNNRQTVLVILLVTILLALPATVACDALGSDGSVVALGSNSDTYTVRPGDTLAGIAAWHGTTVQAMVDANADTYPSLATCSNGPRKSTMAPYMFSSATSGPSTVKRF